MESNIIILDSDNKKRLVCQFVIDMTSKKEVEDVIKLIRSMAKAEPEPEKPKEL